RGEDSRTFHLAALDAAAGLEKLRAVDRRDDGREARFEKFLELCRGVRTQPLVAVAPDDVAVRIDEAGHHRPAARVYRAADALTRLAAHDLGDAPIANDQRSLLDHRPVAVEDPCVRDREVLRRRAGGPGQSGGEKADSNGRCSCHFGPSLGGPSVPIRAPRKYRAPFRRLRVPAVRAAARAARAFRMSARMARILPPLRMQETGSRLQSDADRARTYARRILVRSARSRAGRGTRAGARAVPCAELDARARDDGTAPRPDRAIRHGG